MEAINRLVFSLVSQPVGELLGLSMTLRPGYSYRHDFLLPLRLFLLLTFIPTRHLVHLQ